MRTELALLALFFVACGARQPGGRSAECEACLASGGTWQAGTTCTRDCALMDVSCYRDHCPGPCSAHDCGACEGSEACVAAGCRWSIASEAMWCNGSVRP